MSEGFKNDNEDRSVGSIVDLEALSSHKEDERSRVVELAVRLAFESSRDSIVHSLVKKLSEIPVAAESASDPSGDQGNWIEIESMSRLRSLVGGRFQNLKDRWTQAGFPLREHRGDKDKGFKLDERGWLELANWVAKQGYEVRLRPDKPECLFEIRPK